MAIVHKTASIADYALPIGSNLALTALISDDYDMDGKTARLRVVGSRKAFEISSEDDGATLVIDGQRIQTNSAPDDVATIGQPNEFLAVQKLGVCGWAIDIYDGGELDFRIQGQIEFFDSSGPIPGTFGEFPEIEVSVTPGDALPVTVQVSAVSDYVLPAPTTTALGGVKRNTGTSGQFVTGIDTDGSLLRATPTGAGSGTVTSVAVSGSDGIEIDSGSPITTSGTIALGVNATNLRTHINVADGANAYSHPNHTGDVTSAGDGATTIANDAVTFAKMQNISTDHLIGRHSSGSGDPQQIGLSGGIELSGANLRRAALTGDVTSPAGDNATTIASGAVTEAKCNSSINASLDLADSSIQPGNAALTDERIPTAAGLTSKFGTNKATIADGDKFAILDSASTDAPKHSLFSLVKSTLKTYFDTLYNLYIHPNHTGAVTSTGDGSTALGTFTLAALNAATSDATLIDTTDARLSDARAPTAHSHEGIAILSTGETGGTKFLREDGDGTSSWQTISGGGDALVANNLDQFADVTQAATKTLSITDSTTLAGGSHSGTNTGDQDLSGYILTTAIDTLAELNAIVTDATLIDTNDARLSDSRTPTSHTHGNLTNDGKVGTTANLPLKTGTAGVVEAGAFGTAAGQFAEGNDARFGKDLVIVTDATAAVTLDATNCYPDYIRCTSGSAVTLTLAAGQSAAVGRHWIIRQAAAGVATVSANDSTPAAITRNGDPSTAGQHTEIAVILVADGVVDIVGGAA